MKGISMRPWKIEAIAESSPEREWQTRRLHNLKLVNQEPDSWVFKGKISEEDFVFASTHEDRLNDLLVVHPRYQVDEVVYIRETWATTESQFNRLKPTEIPPTAKIFCGSDCYFAMGKKRSPLFMPAWAARLFLQVTGVEPCRTKDISFEDCLAEGVVDCPFWQNLDYKAPVPLHPDNLSNKEIDRGWTEYARQTFFALYDSINGKGAHERNWDWVYQFRKVPRPEGL